MAHAYTPGLRVTNQTVVRKKRILPIPGQVMVKVGDQVKADTIVARTELPGKVKTINVINLLGILPEDIKDYMLKKEGDPVEKDEVVAENKPLIKWFKTTIKSPLKGSVESISDVTGQVLLREQPQPLEIRAYVDGQVVEIIPDSGVIIESTASFIQGIIGIGGEITAEIALAAQSPDEELSPDKILPDHKDKIIIGGAHVSGQSVKKAVALGVKGIIIGALHAKDLKELLGYDLGVAITGTEKIGITLIVTEGFGHINMAKKTFELLKTKVGQQASMSGATQIRAGVIRPEIIIPETTGTKTKTDLKADWERGALKIGDTIRIIREPYFGQIARVKSLPNELTQIPSESKARVLEATFSDQTTAIIPRANVELIE
ncbi:MAG: hypothetical protein KAS70_06235 [Planctomycetes bacterium]|nr:hypothetical protein [Planctomycetota bacterium]